MLLVAYLNVIRVQFVNKFIYKPTPLNRPTNQFNFFLKDFFYLLFLHMLHTIDLRVFIQRLLGLYHVQYIFFKKSIV